MDAVRTLDIFCGAGGSSAGARAAGAEIVSGIDAGWVGPDAHPPLACGVLLASGARRRSAADPPKSGKSIYSKHIRRMRLAG